MDPDAVVTVTEPPAEEAAELPDDEAAADPEFPLDPHAASPKAAATAIPDAAVRLKSRHPFMVPPFSP